TLAERTMRDLRASARTLGVQLHVVSATTDSEVEDTFASLANLRAGGLIIGADFFFSSRIEWLASLTVRYAVPAVYSRREFAVAGGLMSYGASVAEAYRLNGIYTGRVLKGEKPADLPVQQALRSSYTSTLRRPRRLELPSRCPCPAALTSCSSNPSFCIEYCCTCSRRVVADIVAKVFLHC